MNTFVALFGYIAHDDKPEQWQADIMLDAPQAIIDWLDTRSTMQPTTLVSP